MINHPDAVWIDDTRGLGTRVDDEATRRKIDLSGRLTVYDLGAIYRNLG